MSWNDVDTALPLQYKFLTSPSNSFVDTTPLCDYTTTPVLSGQLLSLPSNGSVVWVTVVVRNAWGSETMMQPGVQLTLTAPTMASLLSQLSLPSQAPAHDNSSSTTGGGPTGSNHTASGGDTGVSATVTALQQAQAAISASLTAASSGDSGSGNTSSGTSGGGSGSSVNIAGVMDTMMLTVMVLQVTACASVQCGAGSCIIVDSAPVCDCSGSGFSGAFCSIAIASESAGSNSSSSSGHPEGGSTSVSASPSPSVLVTAAPPSASVLPVPSAVVVVPQKPCPSSSGVDCSGHGTCLRSMAECPTTSLQCVTACR